MLSLQNSHNLIKIARHGTKEFRKFVMKTLRNFFWEDEKREDTKIIEEIRDENVAIITVANWWDQNETFLCAWYCYEDREDSFQKHHHLYPARSIVDTSSLETVHIKSKKSCTCYPRVDCVTSCVVLLVLHATQHTRTSRTLHLTWKL